MKTVSTSAGLALAFILVVPQVVAADFVSTPEKQDVIEQVDALEQQIADMSSELWDYSEIALLETQSAEFLANILESEGFAVERGVADMPTAFVAEWGTGHPVIGILAEYDALPNIGNDPVPALQPRADGNPHGQGCGHNLFGAGSVGAAIAIKRTMDAKGIKGTVKLFGTPAEETVVGKVYMANAGVFDGIDITLDWHPSSETGVINATGQALNNFQVEFFGKASHSAYDPWNGRSALDAVEMMNHGANLMREHIEPTARIHYVIPDGGEAPNVVPAYAKVWYYVRDVDRSKVLASYEWLNQIAEAAALATQTTHKVTLITGVHELLLNRPLQEAMQANLDYVGAPEFDDDDNAFARELQTAVGIEPLGYPAEIDPLEDDVQPTEGGSTDVAEVTRLAPGVSLYVATAGLNLPWHSWAASASHGRPNAARGASVAAKVLALTAMDFLQDEDLRQRAKAEFDEKMKAQPYVSPIPKGQKPLMPETD
ncbi:MAG: amidohydrolase [Gammaproteobacteria bacterium]|jgi:aminobenzoyl-glutamate utilization protein B|nr:amidohydrolase [Gammaproteobacteria bacterium]